MWSLINSLWPSDAIWWLRSGSTLIQVVAWWHQAITWTNVDLLSVKPSDIHIRRIAQDIPQSSSTKISFEIHLCEISLKSPRGRWVKNSLFQSHVILWIMLCMVKSRHIYPSCSLCILQSGPWDQRTKISSECQDAVWKGLVDAALRMPLHPFGTLSLHLLNVPLPLIPSRAAWRLIYLMWLIPRSTESYIVWVYCLWLFLVFSTNKRFWAWWLPTIF